jgi:hypothetical protein
VKTCTAKSLCLALPLCLSAPALGQDIVGSEVKIVEEASQVALPNSGPRGERTYRKGDVVLDVPLLWEMGATLVDPVTIMADGQNESLVAGQVLQMVVLQQTGTSRKINAYCTPRKASERKADKGALGMLLGGGSLWRKAIRSATDRQLCLLDADDDGIADHSVVVNDGTPAARSPVSIAPAHLDRQKLLPISDKDHLRITLVDVAAKGNYISLLLDVIQQGETRAFDSFGGTNRRTGVALKTGFPQTAEMVGARFEVLAAGGPDRVTTIRWPEGADAGLAIPISDRLQIVMRYY